MKFLRWLLVVFALMPGLWMTFDGTRALIVGDYVTPREGPYAGQLGPWSGLVSKVGIPPRSIGMKVAFVVLGLAWLVSAVAFAAKRPRSERLLEVMSLATLWYLPVGTVVALVQLLGLQVLRSRARATHATV